VLRRAFGAAEGDREDCIRSFIIIDPRVIKSRRKGWAGHVQCMDEMINSYKILFGNLKGRYSSRAESVRSASVRRRQGDQRGGRGSRQGSIT
jgi:hypothetical protein